MNSRHLLLIAVLLVAAILAAGCTGTTGPETATPTATPAPIPSGTAVSNSPPARITTTPQLIAFVANAAEFARDNGRDAAIDEFNDPGGSFVLGRQHVFAVQYDGTIIADPDEPGLLGTNILDMTDSYGHPLIRNMVETARNGRGYVSYTYRNPERDDEWEDQIAVVEDVDGTYFVASGFFASEGEIYPSTRLNTFARQPGVDDLVTYVKSAAAYAKANGKEKAVSAFNDPKGQFVQGELVMMAFDFNGTNLAAPPYSPELSTYHVNLIHYHDPDGVDTIRGMRDLAKEGGGFFYTVAKVTVGGKDVFVPKLDYAEPVDDTWWIFSGIIVPEYSRIVSGDISAFQVRNHTREELFELVNRAVDFAKTNGREKTLAEINDPDGQFVSGDLFVWAESTDGTLLADPFWKSGIGRNHLEYADPYGMKVTRVGLQAMEHGTGFYHALFPNTAVNETANVHKLIYMKAVDDTWWIGSGIYGIEVE
jgi:signal transduction histidine kinase